MHWPVHASGPKHGTWSRVRPRPPLSGFTPFVPSAHERMFVATDKRPGDATTSRGMAPKTELRRINTIRPPATGESGLPPRASTTGGCDGGRVDGGSGGAGGSGARDGAAPLRGHRGITAPGAQGA